MSIIPFFKSLFAVTQFATGERVNHVRGGAIQRTDGYVVAQTDRGVMVEWPRGGTTVLPATELSVIQ